MYCGSVLSRPRCLGRHQQTTNPRAACSCTTPRIARPGLTKRLQLRHALGHLQSRPVHSGWWPASDAPSPPSPLAPCTAAIFCRRRRAAVPVCTRFRPRQHQRGRHSQCRHAFHPLCTWPRCKGAGKAGVAAAPAASTAALAIAVCKEKHHVLQHGLPSTRLLCHCASDSGVCLCRGAAVSVARTSQRVHAGACSRFWRCTCAPLPGLGLRALCTSIKAPCSHS